MTPIVLLERLTEFSQRQTEDLIMPAKLQKDDIEQVFRAATIHKMRLPDSNSATKEAPYIIHQLLTTKHTLEASAVVRSIFCVYSENEQEGALMLLNLIERLRIGILRSGVLGNQFSLDINAGVESLIYSDDTAPFYGGEMITTWKLPAVKREVSYE